MSVAAIIPAYNAERMLARALDSVLAQTVPVDEILVVDDGSTDRTRSIITSYAARNVRVQLLTQKHFGTSRARNHGVSKSTSEYVAFLDADDSWETEKIELQLNSFRAQPKAVLSYTALTTVSQDDNLLEQTHTVPPRKLRARLRLGSSHIVPSCVMVRRAAFLRAGEFRDELKRSADWELWLRLHALGPFCAVDLPLTRHTLSSRSTDADGAYSEAVKLAGDHMLRGLTGIARRIWHRKIISYQSCKAALTARASGEHDKEMGYILRSFAYWPNPFWEIHRAGALAVTLRNLFAKRQAAIAS